MSVGEIAGSILGAIGRFVLEILVQVVFEFLIKGPGYLLVRLFRKEVDPDSGLVVFVGIIFWFVLAISVFFGILANDTSDA